MENVDYSEYGASERHMTLPIHAGSGESGGGNCQITCQDDEEDNDNDNGSDQRDRPPNEPN